MKRVPRHGVVLNWACSVALLLGHGLVWAGTAGTESYTYDALGRARTITFPDGTKSSYDYDAAGNRLSVATGTDITAPSAPTGLTAAAPTSTQVNLSWTASTDTGGSGVAGYKVYRNGSTTALATTTGSGTTYSDNTTAGTTAYTYIVKAYDGAGNNSTASNTAPVTTPDTIAPSVPTGLTATAVSSSQINLSWNASTDTGGSGLKGYKITRNGAALVTTTTTATTYNNTGLTASTNYSYTVAAYDNSNNTGSASAAASATTFSNINPPGGLSGYSPTHGVITLTWAAASGGTAPYTYYVEDCLGSGCTSFVQVATFTTTGGTITGLQYPATYSFRVRAKDATGAYSGYSNIFTTTVN